MLLKKDAEELKLVISNLDIELEELKNNRNGCLQKLNVITETGNALQNVDVLVKHKMCFQNVSELLSGLITLNEICINNTNILKSVLSYLLERDTNVSIIEYMKQNK